MLRISQRDGTDCLPCGYSIGPCVTLDAFQASLAFVNAKSKDYGTPPWIHYSFSGGQVDGKDLAVSLCFHAQRLVYVLIAAEFYTTGGKPWDWCMYSLDVEAATKCFHDAILERMLGKPTRVTRVPNSQSTESQVILDISPRWEYSWGSVSSGHDLKGGGTSIVASYEGRREAATSHRSY